MRKAYIVCQRHMGIVDGGRPDVGLACGWVKTTDLADPVARPVPFGIACKRDRSGDGPRDKLAVYFRIMSRRYCLQFNEVQLVSVTR